MISENSSLLIEPTFLISQDEARALYSWIKYEFIPKEPYERYEQLLRLMNGLGQFIDKYDSTRI